MFFVILHFRYLKCDLELFDLHELDCKFDVMLIDPPLEEYQRRAPGCNFNWNPWTWDEVYNTVLYIKICIEGIRRYKPQDMG